MSTPAPDPSAMRRFERSIRRRIELTQRARRLTASIPAVLQITVAATAAYAVARFLLGHELPIVAVTVTITALGFTRDARPRRVLETIVGILVGITLSEAIVVLTGSGIWQLALVLATTLLVARFFSPSASFAIAAAVQSMLVVVLPAPDGGVFVRSVDGLVGGVLALLVTALIPRDPRRAAQRDSRRLFATIDESLQTVVTALERGDEPAADLALTRLRRTQELVDAWSESLESAIGIATISPFLRRHLPELSRHSRQLAGLDLATRHLRIITRRVDFLVRDGAPRPQLAELMNEVREGIRLLESDPEASRVVLTAVGERLSPGSELPDSEMTEAVIVLLLRPLVVDVLVASGLSSAEARECLPDV
ncbi:FUSC family protein [Marisediminicola sp. LYQ134]|uniref:FUSC family protein n=1 Tax=unclassified Marisediminicola TaxID=2618316 RepID=UPI003983D887